MKCIGWTLAAALALTAAFAHAAAPETAVSSGTAKQNERFLLSVSEGTQLNMGALSIGGGSIGVGPYLDEKGERKYGLTARLEMTLHGEPSKFSDRTVVEGQTVDYEGYRILIVKINDGERGSVVMDFLASPAPKPKPVKHWPFSWFGR